MPSLTLTQPIKQMKIKIKMENGDGSGKGMVYGFFSLEIQCDKMHTTERLRKL